MFEDGFFVHESPSRPKWENKTIQVVGDLAGNPLDLRKKRSQFHNDSYASEYFLAENWYIMVGYDPKSYK